MIPDFPSHDETNIVPDSYCASASDMTPQRAEDCLKEIQEYRKQASFHQAKLNECRALERRAFARMADGRGYRHFDYDPFRKCRSIEEFGAIHLGYNRRYTQYQLAATHCEDELIKYEENRKMCTKMKLVHILNKNLKERALRVLASIPDVAERYQVLVTAFEQCNGRTPSSRILQEICAHFADVHNASIPYKDTLCTQEELTDATDDETDATVSKEGTYLSSFSAEEGGIMERKGCALADRSKHSVITVDDPLNPHVRLHFSVGNLPALAETLCEAATDAQLDFLLERAQAQKQARQKP